MKFFFSVLILFLILNSIVISAKTNGNKIGVKVAVSQNALSYLKDQMLPAAEAAALAADIPEMKATADVPVIGDVDIDLSNMKLNRLSLGNSSILLNSDNTISVSFSGLNMDLTLDWAYRECSWPHISDDGDGEASTGTSSGRVAFAVGTDSNGRPTAKISACDLDLSDLDIDLSGGASWLYNIVIDLFHGKIVDALQDAICDTLHNDVQQQLDDLLANIPVQMPVGDHLAIDYSLSSTSGIVISDQLLIASSLGEFYPRGGQPGKAPGQPVEMPNSVTNTHFQIFASEFSAESLGYASVTSGITEMLVTKDMAPSAALAFFSSDFYGQYAPGLIDKFGEGKDVALFLAIHQTPDVIFSEANGVDLKAGVELTIRVNNSAGSFEDAFTVMLTCDVDAIAKVNDTTISGELTDVSATATLVQTHVGDVDINGINDLVQFALSMGLDALNELLANGTPLPSMQGLSFVDPSILYRDGYLIVATNIKFDLPSHH